MNQNNGTRRDARRPSSEQPNRLLNRDFGAANPTFAGNWARLGNGSSISGNNDASIERFLTWPNGATKNVF
jgi:hypothetical protein